MFWEERLTIPAYIADHTDHLEIWGLARLVQEAADHHTAATGCGFDVMKAKNYAWVLARMHYQIDRMPAVGEEVTIRTWSRGCDGLMFDRDCEVVDSDGKAIIGATTVWVVINYENRRLCRMHDFLENYEHHDRMATDVKKLGRIIVPKSCDECYVKYIDVEESMIDHNNHMNNAEYLKLIFDALSDMNVRREGLTFEIDYNQESKLHDKLMLKRHLCGSTAYFEIFNQDGLRVTAKVDIPANSEC